MSESTVPEPSATPASETDSLQAAAEAIRDEHPEYDEVPVIEADETVPPRPEEEVADADRV